MYASRGARCAERHGCCGCRRHWRHGGRGPDKRSPTKATNAGAFGALATGAYELAAHQANKALQRQQILNQLADQKREIRELQSERARLIACQDQEVPLSRCELRQSSPARHDSANQADHSDYPDASQFELQKQAQEQQDYIAQMKQQVSDLK